MELMEAALRSSSFVSNQSVMIVNTSKPEYNNKKGIIIGYFKQKDRYAVQLNCANKKKLLLKPIHLKPYSDFSFLWNQLNPFNPQTLSKNDGVLIGNLNGDQVHLNGILGHISAYDEEKEVYSVRYELNQITNSYFKKENLSLVWPANFLPKQLDHTSQLSCALCAATITHESVILCNGCGSMMYCSVNCRDTHAVHGLSPHVHKCQIFRSSFINALEKRRYFEQFAVTKTAAEAIYRKSISHVLVPTKNHSTKNQSMIDSWATFGEIFDCNLDVTLCMSDPMTVYYIIKSLYLDETHANPSNSVINIYLVGAGITEFEGIQNDLHEWKSRWNAIFALLLNEYKFRIICIGPELPDALLALKDEELVMDNLIFEFHATLWMPNPHNEEWITKLSNPQNWKYSVNDMKSQHEPDIIIGLHAGLSMQTFRTAWCIVMEYALSENVPIIFTEQSEWSYHLGIKQFISNGVENFMTEYPNKTFKYVEEKNPFHVLHPNEDINCLMFHGDTGFRAVDLRNSFICGVNPQQKV
eukprot:816103_1